MAKDFGLVTARAAFVEMSPSLNPPIRSGHVILAIVVDRRRIDVVRVDTHTPEKRLVGPFEMLPGNHQLHVVADV